MCIRDRLKRTVAGSLVIGLVASLTITTAGFFGLRPLLELLDLSLIHILPGVAFTASGGISSEAELLELKEMGTAAAILGLSLIHI